MDKKILFITALHGNESLGVEIMKRIEDTLPPTENNYEWLIGNPEAYKQNVRFTQDDLNRVAPGSSNSNSYEERRAAELVELSKKYSFAIDIHGTSAKSGIFVLITNPTLENLVLAASLPIKNVVVWAANSSKEKGPVTQYLNCPAVEIECGPKTDPNIHIQLQEAITEIVKNKGKNLDYLFANIKKQQYFSVCGSIENIDTSRMKEFQETEVQGEKFYPLLINSYKQGSIRKIQRIDFFDLLSY